MAANPKDTGETGPKDVFAAPYARVVAGGADRSCRMLRATVILTPDVEGDGKLRLNHWTKDVIKAVETGLAGEGGTAMPWTIPIVVQPARRRPGADGTALKPRPETGAGRTVLATARLLRTAQTVRGATAMAAELWQSSFVTPGDQFNWQGLGDRIAASLSGEATRPGQIADGNVEVAPRVGLGDDAQYTTGVAAHAARRVDAMMSVPQADMALQIEMQRVEELLCSLHSACEDSNLRCEAEIRRALRIAERLTAESAGTTAEEKTPDTTETITVTTDMVQTALLKQRTARNEALRNGKELTSKRAAAADAYSKALAELTGDACVTLDLTSGFADRSTFAEGTDGEDAFDGARELHEYATWPEYSTETTGSDVTAEKKRVNEPDAALDEVARTFFTMQTTPTLARLFGLAIDVEIALEDLVEALGQDDQGLQGIGDEAEFLFLALAPGAGSSARATPWTLAKFRRSGDCPWFWPATEQEVWLEACAECRPENVPQFDGHLVMGARAGGANAPYRFDLTSLEIRTASELEMQRRHNRQATIEGILKTRKKGVSVEQALRAEGWSELAEPSTLQTAGVTLLDRGVLQQSARKLASRSAKADNSAAPDVVLDAEDLTVGVRIDVGVLDRKRGLVWRSLTGRLNDFGTSGDPRYAGFLHTYLPLLTGGFRGEFRIGLDSSLQSVAARLIPNGEVQQNGALQPVEVLMEEAVAVWNGNPMGVEVSKPRSGDYVSCDAFDFGRMLRLPQNGRMAPEFLPPELRYGRGYRFKMRTVYQGGLSLSPDDLPDEGCLGGALFYPPGRLSALDNGEETRPLFRFLRQQRIDAPVLALERRTALSPGGIMGPERGALVIVRSVEMTDKEAAEFPGLRQRAIPRRASRVLLPPQTSFDEARRHGVFDTTSDARPNGYLREAHLTPDGGLPAVALVSRKGFDDQRYLLEQAISYAPEAGRPLPGEAPEDVELGDCVLTGRRGAAADARYFPDPAGTTMAFGLRRIGGRDYLRCTTPVAVDISTVPNPAGRPRQLRYPDRAPVRIDVRAGTGEPAGNPGLNQILAADSSPVAVSTGDRTRQSWRIEATLAPGEAFHLDAWMVPSPEELARTFSLVQSLAIYASRKAGAGPGAPVDPKAAAAQLKADLPDHLVTLYGAAIDAAAEAGDPATRFVGPGGHVAPPKELLVEVGKLLHEQMKRAPLPEIASVRTIKIVHCVNRPVSLPVLAAAPEDAGWLEPVGGDKIEGDRPLRILRPSSTSIEAAQTIDPKTGRPQGLATGAPAFETGSTEIVLDGSLLLALDTIDGFELMAEAVHPSSSDFDNRARGRSLLKKRSGAWPHFTNPRGNTFYRTSRDIFGFAVNREGEVRLDASTFTLLRVETIGRPVTDPASGRQERLDLRAFWLSDSEPKGTWRVTRRHVFPDSKARRLKITPRALSRTASFLTTARLARRARGRLLSDGLEMVEASPFPAALSFRAGASVDVILPATTRPAKCDALSPEVVFSWTHGSGRTPGHRLLIRETAVRIRLGREWFSSGVDEKLGIVVWPPHFLARDKADEYGKVLKPGERGYAILDDLPHDHYPIHVPAEDGTGTVDLQVVDLSAFMDEDLGPGGRFVTRMGADPIRGAEPWLRKSATGDDLRPGIFMPPTAFRRDLWRKADDPRRAEFVRAVIMPVVRPEDVASDKAAPSSGDLPPGQTLTVGLMTYVPRFDPEAEEWYVDVDLDAGALADPFVRFGLVRYQCHTRPELAVSEPVVQWSQLLPRRQVSVSEDNGGLRIEVRGVASLGAADPWRDALEAALGKPTEEEETDKPDAAEVELASESIESGGTGKALPAPRFARPRLRMRLFRQYVRPDGTQMRAPVDAADCEVNYLSDSNVGAEASSVGWLSTWNAQIDARATEGELVLYLEEIEWRRPATYPAEPIPAHALTSLDADIYVPSGPRFAACIPLGDLTKVDE